MILKTYTRLFTTDPDGTVTLVKAVHETEPHLDFAYGPLRLVGIGDVLVVAGPEQALAPIRANFGPWVVRDLDEVRRRLVSLGAEVVQDVSPAPTGRMMYVRHPDGSLIEYVEWTAELVERHVADPLRRGIPSSQI